MHVAYALSFDTTEGFWCFHIPLRACHTVVLPHITMHTRNTCRGVGNHQLVYQYTLWRTRNTCIVPVGVATTKHLIMHAAYALSFDTN
jgi:hypothetical protein